MLSRSITLGRAKQIAGTLSFPSKMPGTSYSLPAKDCITGAKLAQIVGTACSLCYALRGGGFYSVGNAPKGMHRRLISLRHPQWVEAMVKMLTHVHGKPYIKIDLGEVGVRLQREGGKRWRYNDTGFHRWHDSGDLQSVEHFANICAVARATPKIAHWLPTQELGMVKRYLARGGKIPQNLVIRVSSVMVDDQARRSWPHTSSVITEANTIERFVCPAPQQQHQCKKCRACWDRKVRHVAYALH